MMTCALTAPVSSQTTTYRYDVLGRVLRSTEGDGRAVAYDYDAAGNRVSLSNGAPSVELSVKTFSASSNAGGFSGLTATGAMRDQVFSTKVSSHVTASEASAWIMADLGAGQSIDRVDLAGPDAAVVAGGAAALTGAMVETSDDANAWSVAATVGTVSPGVYKTVNLGGARARYVRVRRASGLVGVGDLRLYSGGQRSNRSPVTVDDQVELLKGQTLVFDPRFNDKDLDGDALSLSAAGSGAAHGQVTFTASAITYKPDTSYVGTDSFDYTVIDTSGASATGKVMVTVKDTPNRPPVVQDLGAATEVGITNTFSVVANDPDNDPLSISGVSAPSGGGTVTPLGGLSFRYAPPSGFSGYDTFTLTVSDGRGLAAAARASIWVYSSATGNHAPVAFDDTATTSKGVALTYNPRGNDTDVDHDILTITAVQGTTAQGGYVSKAADGSNLTYTPPSSSFTGSDNFTYTIGDGRGGTSTAKVTVYVTGAANANPTADADGWTTSANTNVGGDPRQNDNDLDGDVLTITAVTQPANGSAGIFLSGKWITYTPTAGFTGTDSFSYTISDGRGGSVSAPVTVTVNAGGNRTPVPVAKTYTIPPNQSFTFDPTVGTTDADNDPVSVISADMDNRYPLDYPVLGSLSRTSAGPTNDEALSKYLTYTPPAGATGFTVKALYIVTDGHGQSVDGAGTSISPPTEITIIVSDSASAAAPSALAAKIVVPYAGQKSTNLQALGSYTSLEVVQAPPTGSAVINGTTATYSAPSGYSGKANFTYRARGAGGIGPEAVVDVTVGPDNAAPPPSSNTNPVAVNETVNDVAYGTARTIYVLNNDYDANGDPLTINPALPQAPSHGQAQVSGSAIVYTPASGHVGADSFVYGISDGKGGAATATVNITVLPQANRAPVAAADTVSVLYGQAKAITVLANDYDPDGDTVALSSAGGGAHGGVVLAGGALTYAPTAGYSGSDSFSYTIVDGRGGSATGAVSVTVLPAPNASPSATADSYTVAFNSQAQLAVRDNDSDPDGDALTLASVSSPAHGTATIAIGAITYTPTTGYSGVDGFSYTISDGKGGSASANVAITVKPKPNQAPVAVNDSVATDAGAARSINILANDSDPDGDTLSIASVTVPAHGSAVIAGGQVTYTPAGGYVGADSFGYSISDGRGGSATASVSVNVQAANRVPSAVNDTTSTTFNTAKTIAVLANDSDPDGDALIITAVATPGHGTAVIAGGQVTYTPTTGYSGPDSFGYTISDGRGGSASASVNVTVDPRPNQAPAAANDTVTVTFNTAKTIGVLVNDSDPDGDTLVISSVTTPAHGTAVIAGGQVTYTPTTGYSGADSFSYTVSDGRGATATATVSVTVQVANRAPTAVNDSYTLVRNVAKTLSPRSNDTDLDNDPLVITAVTTPTYGTASIVAGGSAVLYTPSAGMTGGDAFSYTISDGRGGSASAQVSLSIVANRAPLVVNDVVWMSYGPSAPPLVIDVLANDSDPDGDGLSISGVGGSGDNNIYVQNGKIVFEKAEEAYGPYTFPYVAMDTKGATTTGQVTVYVAQIVLAQGDSLFAQSNQSTTYSIANDLLANDRNASGAPVTADQLSAISSNPSHGTISLNRSSGAFTYTPSAGFVGIDAFQYTLSDGQGGAGGGEVRITVAATVGNRPPRAGPRYVEAVAGRSTPMPQLLALASDPDGDPLTISVSAGQVETQVVNGVLIYTPPAWVQGAHSFAYVLSDGKGGTTQAQADVLVRYNNPPVAANDSYVAQTGLATPIAVLVNDSDFNGDALTVSFASPPAHGSVVIVGGKSLIYTPLDGYAGADSFVYTISDGNGGSATATVSITVLNTPNTPPVANNDGPVTVSHNTAITISPRTNDSDPDGDVLTITAVSAPANGVTVLNAAGTSVTYTPATGYRGADSFSYTLSDGRGGTASATVSLTVLPPPNRAPTAVNDSYGVENATATTLSVLANDTDPDADPLSVASVTTPAHGTTAISGVTIVYTPATGYSGADSFSYTVADGRGGQASAQVSITVAAPNRSPVAPNGALTTNRQVAVNFAPNATDPDADTLTITNVSTPAHGTATKTGANQITYVSSGYYSGADSFTYAVSDGRGGTATGTVSVTVNNGGNLPPTAVNDYVTVAKESSITFNPAANDSDDGGFIVIGTLTASHGTVSRSGNQVTYSPSPGYSGPDQIAYTISDFEGLGASAIIYITVTP